MDLEFMKKSAMAMLDYADGRTLEFIYYFLLRRIDWKPMSANDDTDTNPPVDCL